MIIVDKAYNQPPLNESVMNKKQGDQVQFSLEKGYLLNENKFLLLSLTNITSIKGLIDSSILQKSSSVSKY